MRTVNSTDLTHVAINPLTNLAPCARTELQFSLVTVYTGTNSMGSKTMARVLGHEEEK